MAMLLVIGSVTVRADQEAPSAARGAFVEPTELVLRTADQSFEVLEASEVEVRVMTFEDNTVTACHAHQAPVLVVVNSGQFTRQYEDCSTSVHGPGEVSIHPGQPVDRIHRAHFTAGTVIGLVFFGLPPGESGSDFDVEAPDCPDPTS